MLAVMSFQQIEVQAAIWDSNTYDASQFPTFSIVFSGNITLDSATAESLLAKGKLPLGLKTYQTSDFINKEEIGYVFPFGVVVSGSELGTLALDDVDKTVLDPRADAFGETAKLGATSFIGARTELLENTTDVNGVTEYFFYEHSTGFDSEDYQYLLIEDASTPSTTNSQIIVGTTTTGNFTVFDDILLGTGTGDLWYRLDQHCNSETVKNVTITNMKLSSVYIFTLKSDNQWVDSRYIPLYVGETEYTAALNDNFQQPYRTILTSYNPTWNLGQGRKRPIGINSVSWLDSINASEVLACRSSTAENSAVVRASGWTSYQTLEEDLLEAIAEWEQISVSGIRDYACSNAIAYWSLANKEVVDAVHEEMKEVASQTNDIQTFFDLSSERTIASSVMLVGTEPDVFGNAVANYKEQKTSIGIQGTFVDFLKQASEKVYDVTTSAIASAKNLASQTITWGQDLIGGVVNTGTGIVNGIVDTTGEVAKNVVSAVTSKDGVLNPMGFMDKIRANLKWVLIIGLLVIAIIVTAVVLIVVQARKTATGVTNSELAKNVNADVSMSGKDFL